MAELMTSSVNDLVKNAVVLWNKTVEMLPTPARSSGLFDVFPVSENSGNTREVSEIDANQYAKLKGEGEQAKRSKIQQGYSKTLTVKRIAEDVSITYEMRKYNKYPEVVAQLTSLGGKFTNRLELDLTHRLTFGASTYYTDMDGATVGTTCGDTLALISASHTLKGSSTTYSNVITSNPQLSKGALEVAERIAVENTYNHLGEKSDITFDILYTTDDPNLVNTAREILQSSAEVSAANSGVVNVYKAKFRHVILPRLATDKDGAVDATKRLYWGIASSMGVRNNGIKCGVWEEGHLKLPAPSSNAEEFSTDDLSFGVRGGYGIEALAGSAYKQSAPTA